MPIVITTPIEVSLNFKKGSKFSIEEIFKLAQAIDEYEIAKELSSTLVVDIQSINSAGETHLLVTPKESVSYDMLSEHLKGIIAHISEKDKFSDIDMEMGDVKFLTEQPGMPSELLKEVETIRKIKDEIVNQEEETRSKLDESRKILDEILTIQKGRNSD